MASMTHHCNKCNYFNFNNIVFQDRCERCNSEDISSVWDEIDDCQNLEHEFDSEDSGDSDNG